MSGYTGSLIIGWLNYCFYPVSLWIKRYWLVYNQSELWNQSFLLLHQCGALEVKNTVLHFSAFVISISYCTGQKASSPTLEKKKKKKGGEIGAVIYWIVQTHTDIQYMKQTKQNLYNSNELKSIFGTTNITLLMGVTLQRQLTFSAKTCNFL